MIPNSFILHRSHSDMYCGFPRGQELTAVELKCRIKLVFSPSVVETSLLQKQHDTISMKAEGE